METKTCSRCKQEKPINEFGWRQKSKNIRQYQCVLCMRISSKENYQRNKHNIKRRVKNNKTNHRQQFQDWKKTLKCSICNESEPCCLDFHHIDPKEKEHTISRLVDYSFRRVLEEAKKCVVVCRNCHAKLHEGVIELP